MLQRCALARVPSASALASALRSASTMRAVVLDEPGPITNLKLHEAWPVPYADEGTLPDTHVRIKVAACAVAYRDIIDRTGGFPFMQRPTILGHEFSGVVEAAGPESRLSVGERVCSLHWAQDLGWPAPFDSEAAMQSFIGLLCDGGYAEYAAGHHSAFVSVPDHWEAVHAAPLVSTYGTVWQGAVVTGKLQAGERVLVTGASGGVGTAAVQMASRMGCHVVAATSQPDEGGKRGHLLAMGADVVVDARDAFDKDPNAANVDMVIECVGEPTFGASLKSLRSGGRLVLVGNVTNATAQLPLGLCIVKSLSVIGTDSCAAAEVERLMAWMDEHELRPHVAEELRLDDVGRGHAMLEGREVSGRLVMVMDKEVWAGAGSGGGGKGGA